MKPFDLEKALAGEPVVTRQQEIGEYQFSIRNKPHNQSFHLFKMTDSISGNEYFNIVDDCGHAYSSLSYSPPRSEYDDLFMAPVKKQEWINIHYHLDKCFPASQYYYVMGQKTFTSKEEAEKHVEETGAPNFVKSVLIREWEE